MKSGITAELVTEETSKMYVSLRASVIDCAYPVYFGRKTELTDKRGVFYVAEAELFVGNENL